MKSKYHIFFIFNIILNIIFSTNLFTQNYFNDSAMVYINNNSFYQEFKDGKKHSKQKVLISEFYICKYEVTNLEYCKYLNDAKLKKDTLQKFINLEGKTCRIFLDDTTYKVKSKYKTLPVTFVSWYGANAYCKFYNLRLPTETEWEYVAKRETIFFRKIFNKHYKYSGSNNAEEVAWFKKNSKNTVHKVGLKLPNYLGIFDMSGNIDEWCSDWYNSNFKNTDLANPKGPSKGIYKVYKGGSWYNSEKMINTTNIRATNPRYQKATIGFRVAKDIDIFCPIK